MFFFSLPLQFWPFFFSGLMKKLLDGGLHECGACFFLIGRFLPGVLRLKVFLFGGRFLVALGGFFFFPPGLIIGAPKEDASPFL